MCGIGAIFAYRATASPVDREEIGRITASMTARGPDAGGTWMSADGRVALGSRRLAIIDLSPDANQPLFDPDGELAVVFNGEIYNHRELRERLAARGARFRTTSDTEVLLQMYRHYGEEMVELLRGMFAFAIWDTREGRMFVARDPYGIKPLYVADDGATIRIASQVKALLAGGAVSKRRDPAGVAGFFVTGTVPEPFTICESIRAVEAGTSFFVTAEGPTPPRRDYSLAAIFRKADQQRTIAALLPPATLLAERVEASLAAHSVADVPVGAFLSAGIDSTTLVALAMERWREPVRTVTVAFEEFRGLAVDEAPLAERFARTRGTIHTTRVVTRDEFRRDLPRFFAAMDQPTIDGINTWFASKAAHELGLKVAISGLGGDELFGSYPAFRNVPRAQRLSRVPLGGVALRILKPGNPKVRHLARHGGSVEGAYLLQRGLFMPEELPLVMHRDEAEEGLRRLALPERIAAALDPDPATDFGRVATLEASFYMRNQLLRDTDWASMAHSLEVRTPLVDATLIRQIAPLLIEKGSRCKRYFAEAPRHPLPADLQRRRKTGFLVPLGEWAELPPDGTTTRMRSWARMVFESYA